MGHENAYNLHWFSSSGRPRYGFAHVAKEANVPVVLVAGRNNQEMGFNLIAFLWNRSRLGRLFDMLLGLPFGIGWMASQIKLMVWWIVCTFLSIPVPVKVTAVVSAPMWPQPHETPQQFASRVEKALQKMLDENNPGGLNYMRAIRARLCGKSRSSLLKNTKAKL